MSEERYGIWCVKCPSCGWQNISRKKPSLCVACKVRELVPTESDFHSGPHDVACFVCTLRDNIEKRIYEMAEQRGYYVVKLSEKRYAIMTSERGYGTVQYNDKQERCYLSMKVVCGPCSWKDAMAFLRRNTQDLPDYLKRG